ncbi:hypothetical protein [Abiotrophia sp. HMSC24B09]|uniref:hypothetical protein n=1 Tax=Abiotrophia sp. HMSC24B09 TaxID=1581061 RepID=UPI0025BA389D|nr:hypothetical protein [Abiotrophia sp. HMSC24B09]
MKKLLLAIFALVLMVPSLARAESGPQTAEEYKDYFTQVEGLITDDVEKSYNQYMDFIKATERIPAKKETWSSQVDYLLYRTGDNKDNKAAFFGSTTGQTLGYAFDQLSAEAIKGYLAALAIEPTSELESMLTSPDKWVLILKNDKAIVQVFAFGGQFGIRIYRDLAFFVKVSQPADQEQADQALNLLVNLYTDHFAKVESLINDDTEASYKNYMDLIKNTHLQDADEITLEDGRSVKYYKISEDQEGIIASPDGKTLGYSLTLGTKEALLAYLKVLKLEETSELKKLLADPQVGKDSFVLIQNDKVGVAIRTFGDKESKNLRFNILVMRDLEFYQKSVKEYKEKEKD